MQSIFNVFYKHFPRSVGTFPILSLILVHIYIVLNYGHNFMWENTQHDWHFFTMKKKNTRESLHWIYIIRFERKTTSCATTSFRFTSVLSIQTQHHILHADFVSASRCPTMLKTWINERIKIAASLLTCYRILIWCAITEYVKWRSITQI